MKHLRLVNRLALLLLATMAGGGDGPSNVPRIVDVPTGKRDDEPSPIDQQHVIVALEPGPPLPSNSRGDVDAIARSAGGQPVELDQLLLQGGGPFNAVQNEVQSSDLARAVMGRINSQVRIYRVGGNKTVSELRESLLAQGLKVSYIHRLGLSGHWGGFPGTKPVIVDKNHEFTSGNGSLRVIGMVDSGVAVDSPNAKHPIHQLGRDVVNGKCSNVSHGEAVAHVMKRVNSSAEVISASAFSVNDSCWVTDEARVLAATNWVLTQADHFDAFVYALGTHPHSEEDDNGNVIDSEPSVPVLIEEIIKAIRAVTNAPIYAAAGNSSSEEPVYPAAHHDVIGVGCRSDVGEQTVWDDKGVAMALPKKREWMDFGAPGCAIITHGVLRPVQLGQAAAGGNLDVDQVIIWSGSSFSVGIAAALGATSDVGKGQMPEGLINDRGQYPNAPDRCNGPTIP